MTKRFLLGCVAGLIAEALIVTPARAQEDDLPPPPDPQQQEPGVEYQDVCPRSEPAPACPPCAEQAAAAAQSQAVSPHHGLLLMGYVGVSAFAGKAALTSGITGLSLSVGPGLRVGGLIGFYATPRFSLNAELGVDIINSDDPYGYWATGGTRTVIAISPLFHLAASASSAVEFAVGPKLGMRWMSLSSQSNEGFHSSGTLLGANAGVFVRGGVVMLGGLVSFDFSKLGEACRQPGGSTDYCAAGVSDISSEKVVSVSGSILY